YPLFTMLLRLVSVGAAETAWRATLLSNLAGAIGGVLATLLFFEIAVRATARATDARARTAALAGSLTAGVIFGVSPLWWSQSIIIEVYALHLCFVSFALLMAFRYGGRPRRLWILAYAAGLALTHH